MSETETRAEEAMRILDERRQATLHFGRRSNPMDNELVKKLSEQMNYTPPQRGELKRRREAHWSSQQPESHFDRQAFELTELARKEYAAEEAALTAQLDGFQIAQVNIDHVAQLLARREALRFMLAKPLPDAPGLNLVPQPPGPERLPAWLRLLRTEKAALLNRMAAAEPPERYRHKADLTALDQAIEIAWDNLKYL